PHTMSDELLDGRDLRKRRPARDEDSNDTGSEDLAPLPRAKRSEDSPSGPYVVLEPPPEANIWLDREKAQALETASSDAPAAPPSEPADQPHEPAARVTLRPSGSQSFIPEFDTTTGSLPPVPDD